LTSSSLERLYRWLRRANLIPTQQRLLVLSVFDGLAQGEHLSAEAVVEALQQQGKTISRSTVYRTLNRFIAHGLLRTLPLGRNRQVYELNQGHWLEHHHLPCLQCEQLVEFQETDVLDLASRVASKQGFEYRACQMIVVGLCPRCYALRTLTN
jgi:Fur family ferric uptake transcriptional regulator